MNAIIYENIEKLSTGELWRALQNIKDNMKNIDLDSVEENNYYAAIVAELEKRNREG